MLSLVAAVRPSQVINLELAAGPVIQPAIEAIPADGGYTIVRLAPGI